MLKSKADLLKQKELATYNNSMRLGQRFNSYTQQSTTRIDEADDGASDLTPADYRPQPQGNRPPTSSQIMPWAKPQIVTCSSHFVDKTSDVTDAMNISGSLSIKTATIYSDINFHLQVKVTNQIHEPPEYCIFIKISKVKKEECSEVYGDCFISGWEEDGELNAVISIKGIESLKKAAAALPDLVAVTPQRTYAILTKYTSLTDFQMKKDGFSLLDYKSAGIYTNALLDHNMDYKAVWKQISHATYELKGNRATIETGRPGEVIRQSNYVNEEDEDEKEDSIQFPVFSPAFAGLIHARKVCRFEMAKIVNEVDLVARSPKLATDTRRDSFFLNPLVFEQLLPVVRSLSPESARLRLKDPNAALLLGYVAPSQDDDALPPVYLFKESLGQQDLRLQNSVQRCSWKAEDYLMHGCAGLVGERAVHSSATLVNDLETIDATFRPDKIMVWLKDQTVGGIRLKYAKGVEKSHGSCEGPATHQWNLASDGSEIIVEVVVREEMRSAETVITSITFVTSYCNVFDTVVPQGSSAPSTLTVGPDSKVTTFLRPEGAQWSLPGFFSFSANSSTEHPAGTPCTLGIIWSKDTFVPLPAAPLSVQICKSYLSLGKSLQANVKRFKHLKNFASFPFYFILGATAAATSRNVAGGAASVDDISEPFNALDGIDIDWVVKTIAFASNGEVIYGNFGREVWKCDGASPLIVAKLTAGRISAGGPGFLDAVEFIRADLARKKGEQAAWPLDVSTLRYLGEGDMRVTVDVGQVVERAPNFGGNARWTCRGFYGESKDGFISRLGIVWGRG
ncbi:uncharacterized protein FSUBG_13702 [Fusarium subglutinans]|uniref:Jacalin-type lectin domain-containing protein n=1 Tax=Gibberella subglutinans TaxID=42677 RepID=A0A8H5KTF2_GIBSU|nr:uncharacterized protein FSUBG_13702 [Fusarium subglutinans]KAF5578869.1 hypothetical protein FSUBG_13702 [Fusarium subglutinans]